MSINLPLQRICRSANMPAFTHSVRPRVLLPLRSHVPRRTIFGIFRRNRDAPILDPMSEQFSQRKQKDNQMAQGAPSRGNIASGSILDDGTAPAAESEEQAGAATTDTSVRNRDRSLMAPTLDPNPRARQLWERKMLVRDIRKRGRINRATLIARREREHLAKSQFIKGSIKKLMPLARQIAGKPIDDAMIQMRFSKKKAAKDILEHLERARDEAVVMRGMGLGGQGAEGEEKGETQRMVVQDKKGKRRVVTDQTAMYVDQAWVGRGKPDYGLDYRARGRGNRLTKAYTSISVILKEEKTRIRQMNERADKEAAKKPWLHLPDRPVTRQTQYPLW